MNIAGLSIGIASCLIISLFVFNELSYDRFNKNANDIVRVVFRAKINGELMKEAVVMAPVASALENELPEVVEGTRIRKIANPKITIGQESYRNTRLAFVDPNIFKVFTLPIVSGKQNDPLKEPGSVVITKTEAKKLFGNSDAVGKTLSLDDSNKLYEITAVIEDIPSNSHFHFDVLASTRGFAPAAGTSWVESEFHTYLLLKKGTSIEKLESKLPAVVEKYMGPQMKGAIGMSFSEFKEKNEIGLYLQPLTDIHLKSDFTSSTNIEPGGDIQYVYIFTLVAIFMLLIACINFINLSTAAASKRAKEIGVRKVLGSNRSKLIYQFLSESLIATTIAMAFALLIFRLLLPIYNDLSGQNFELTFLWQPKIVVALILLVLTTSFLAGGYPAFFLSSFKPVDALKAKFGSSQRSTPIRSALVISQFVISAGLIFCTLIVRQQLSFIQTKDLGYTKKNIIVIRESYLLEDDQDNFKNHLLGDSRVENVSTSAFIPAGFSDNEMSGIYLGSEYQRRMYVYNIDDQYIPTMGMKITKGRNFEAGYGTDSTGVILNQSAVKALGFGEVAVGKTIMRDLGNGKEELTVIGVVQNFNFKPLHQVIEPLIMLNRPYGGLIIRTKKAEMSGLIEKMENLWNSYGNKEAFSYTILDDAYNEIYLDEKKMGNILGIFAILTILVACLGLFGLVTYTADQRFKEIAIRKVLGASPVEIVSMLSRDFLRLIGISLLIAFPVAFYFMHEWLQDFAFRISIEWWNFLLTALIVLVIAFSTICCRSFLAARANPTNVIKAE